jgi:hypothetical protein
MPTTLEEAADAFYAAGNRLLAGDRRYVEMAGSLAGGSPPHRSFLSGGPAGLSPCR